MVFDFLIGSDSVSSLSLHLIVSGSPHVQAITGDSRWKNLTKLLILKRSIMATESICNDRVGITASLYFAPVARARSCPDRCLNGQKKTPDIGLSRVSTS